MSADLEYLESDSRAAERRAARFQNWYDSVPKWHDHFVFSPSEKANWTPLTKQLSEARVALVSTAGIHLKTQEPFADEDEHGDWSYRVIPADAGPDDFDIHHTHYDHTDAEKDINCMYPLHRLIELAKEGFIGEVAPRHIGMMGFIPNPAEMLRTTAPEVAKLLLEDGVDVALMTPGCAICHQSIGLVQNTVEGHGITTISITMKPELTERVNVPRAAYLRFPYGNACGSPHQPDAQREIVKDVLGLIELMDEPAGRIVKLPYRWRGSKR